MRVYLGHHLGVARIGAVWPRCHHKNQKKEKEEMEEKTIPRHQSLVCVEKRKEELFEEEGEVEGNCENKHQRWGELKARLERGVTTMSKQEENTESEDEQKM